jgi:hypothetical protein
MCAAELIRDVRRHGGHVTVEGNDLNLTAAHSLPANCCQLRTHKGELLSCLQGQSSIDHVLECIRYGGDHGQLFGFDVFNHGVLKPTLALCRKGWITLYRHEPTT